MFLLLVFVAAAVGLIGYKIFGSNTGSFSEGTYFYIPTGANYAQVKHSLKNKGFVKDIGSFDLLARQAGYPGKIRAGKFHIPKGINNYDLIRMLRSGQQVPVKLVLNRLRTKDDLVRFISSRLEADSLALRQLLNDPVYLAQFGLDTGTALCAILPDTYEYWWNTPADKVFRKLATYYTHFWNEDRKKKALDKGLTPQQAIILASIVEEETNYKPEMPDVASVYLNRLHRRMKLQADPTVKYAVGDFTLRRITAAHTAIASPYNTYFREGLPPGPICTPAATTIEAVLNAPKTPYLYFCAKEDFSGQHRFATTYAEHRRNAALYHRALNGAGIKR